MARIRIAKNGGDIDDDPKDLVLDTDETSLMIYDDPMKGNGITSHTHNLGYYPIVFAFFEDSGKWHPQNSIAADYSNIEMDTNTIYIDNAIGQRTKLFISGNAVDNSVGSGKETATGKLRVAKDGYDAETETDIRRFQFCSGLDLFKKDTSLSGTVTFTTDDDFFWEEEKTIAHNLGYVPFATAIDSAGYLGAGGEIPLDWGFNNFYFYLTSTNIVFGVAVFSKEPEVQAYTFKYQIYRNKVA